MAASGEACKLFVSHNAAGDVTSALKLVKFWELLIQFAVLWS